MGVTPLSACPWLDHSASGLIPRTERPVQTRFRCAFTYRLKLARKINSLTHYTKGTRSRARRRRAPGFRSQDTGPRKKPLRHRQLLPGSWFWRLAPGGLTLVSPLPLLVGIRFQVCFTPLVGVLFTFPSRYWCTIGHRGVLRLGGWSPHVQTGFLVSRPTQGRTATFYPYGAVTRSGPPFQTVPVLMRAPLAWSAFARHYLGSLG